MLVQQVVVMIAERSPSGSDSADRANPKNTQGAGQDTVLRCRLWMTDTARASVMRPAARTTKWATVAAQIWQEHRRKGFAVYFEKLLAVDGQRKRRAF